MLTRSAAKRGAHTTVASIEDWVEQNLGAGKVVKRSQMGSSGWSSASVYTLESGKKVFVKQGRDASMFQGEALGLRAMYDTHTLRIPQVYHHGELSSVPGEQALRGGGYFILMEYLEFRGRPSQRDLGRGLARMHLSKPSDENARQGKFGFAVDNTIGGTPQPNGWMDDWVAFFGERRLRHQLDTAGDARLSELGAKLLANLHKLFEGITVKPCLLHGDLWSGNISAVEDGEWAILDPATYYGHHEAEFGMQWCAGFSTEFWQGYHELIPKEQGYEDRKQLYMLYHYLNHYNLFGGGYRGQAQSILQQLTLKYAS